MSRPPKTTVPSVNERDGRDVQAAVAIEGAGALLRVEQVVDGRGVDHAGGDFAVLLQTDEGGEIRNAADEVLGPVDRIDDPLRPRAARGSAVLTELFTHDTVVRKALAQHLDDALLALAVGPGHG